MTFIKTATAALLLSAAMTGTAQAQLIFTDETGEVGPGDRRDGENNLYDEYSFTANAGEQLRISVNNLSDLDPYVIVYGPGGAEIVRNDDANDSLNAQVLFNVPRSGAYRVVVRGFLGSTGRYRVVMENLSYRAPATLRLTGDQTGMFNTSVPRINGDGVHYIDYRVRLTAGQEIVINMQSGDFDSYLYVYDAGNLNSALASNDDSNGTLDSAILFVAPRTGDYVVRASQLSHADGSYRLTVRRMVPF
jgi:Bacterial pre-peptidase C-terminal domain